MPKKILHRKSLLLICISIILISQIYVFVPKAIASSDIDIAVFSNDVESPFEKALQLDQRTGYMKFTAQNQSEFPLFASSFKAFFILEIENLSLTILEYINKSVHQGAGVFMQTNSPNQKYPDQILSVLDSISPVIINISEGYPKEYELGFGESINTREQYADHFISSRIGFLSMPQLKNLTISSLKSGSVPLVLSDRGFPILASSRIGNGESIILCTPVRPPMNSNKNLPNWPLFNYMIFTLANYLRGITDFEEFGDWYYSPVPHTEEKIIVISLIGLISMITFGVFAIMKRRSRLTPLEYNPDFKVELEKEKMSETDKQPKKKDKGIKKDMLPELSEIEKQIGIKNLDWDTPGYHKPLSGFFTIFFLTMALLLPLVIIVMYIVPTFILTDPSQMGIMFITGNIFSAVFIAGDFGLAQAFDKFVGEEYIKNPKQAMKYVQFFIWFQMISGLIQTSVIALLGLFIIPKTLSMAFMSYQFVLKAFIQWPGIGYLWTHSLKAIQRADKEQVVNLITLILFDVIGMAIFSGLFLSIGNSNPRIGPVVGGAMGLTVAEVAKTFGLLIISGIIFSKTDKRFRLMDMFRIDFDKKLVKDTLLFGLKAMLSTVIFLFGNFFVTIIIMLRLDNYTYWGTFIGSATLLLYPVTFMIVLFESQLPTIAESYSAGCQNLTKAYITYAWKYTGTFGIFIGAAFLFFVGSFLTVILPDLYKPMGYFVGFYSITKFIMLLGDFSRLFLISINKVGKYIIFVLIEQIIRVFIFVLLIDTLEQPELLLIWGELPGVIIKVIVTWVYTNKKVISVKINIYQTVIAPLIATSVFVLIGLGLNEIYIVLIRLLFPLIPTIIFTFLIFSGLFLVLYPFILGCLGAWDSEGLAQLRFASYTAGPSRSFAKLFYKFSVLGSKLSPNFGKYAISFQGIENDLNLLLGLQKKRDL